MRSHHVCARVVFFYFVSAPGGAHEYYIPTLSLHHRFIRLAVLCAPVPARARLLARLPACLLPVLLHTQRETTKSTIRMNGGYTRRSVAMRVRPVY